VVQNWSVRLSQRLAVVLIVRDEAGRVGRALESVRGAVDTWLIVDTGSTDSTIEEIHRAAAGWPGALLERKWVSFGENRTELLREARQRNIADWLLTMDADHVVEGANQIRRAVARGQSQEIDALMIPFTSTPLVWTERLLRADLPWRYVGATREYLTCDRPFTRKRVDAPQLRDLADGSSRTNKWRRDVEMLRKELTLDPEDARAWFYLGESYRGLRQHQLATIAYTNCALKTHSDEERYLALTLSGEMLLAHGDTDEGLQRLMLANGERPQRREALLMACQVLNQLGRHGDVLSLLGSGGVDRPIPRADLAGILPAAYGAAMAHEQAFAKGRIRVGEVPLAPDSHRSEKR
jgi:tetratricopeptide (TPR) repeat protein